MPRHLVSALAALAALASAGCGTTDRTLDVTWERTDTGLCKAPGHEAFAGEREITLRYVRALSYFDRVCSNKLEAALKAAGTPIVKAVVRRRRHTDSYSLCSIAGLKDDPPGVECAFRGHVVGGISCSGPGDCTKPSPWD